MNCLLAPFLCFALASQERPLVRGAYRGPYDEVLAEAVAGGEYASGSEGDSQPDSRAVPVEGWERWEFWFEQERGSLLLGPLEDRAAAILPNGRYGTEDWSLSRERVLQDGLPVLLGAAASPLPELREAAMLALGRTGAVAGRDALARGMDDPIAQVRQAALLGLGLIADDRALVLLGERYSDNRASVGDRAFAALGLGLSGRKEARNLIAVALERDLKADRLYGESETELLATVWAVGLLKSANLVPLLIRSAEDLAQTAARSSLRVRAQIIWALGKIGATEARPWLITQLRSSERNLARAAALALGRLGDRGAVSALAARYSQGGDLQLRIDCLLALGQLGGKGAQHALLALKDEVRSHRQLHSAWALAVGLSGTAAAVDGLLADFTGGTPATGAENARDMPLRRDEERLRGALALGLAFFGDARVVDPLARALLRKGVDPDFAGYLSIALGKLGGERAEVALKSALVEAPTQADARRGLATGLALLGTEDGAEACAGFLTGDRNPNVRYAAAAALARVRSGPVYERLCKAVAEGLEGPVASSADAARLAHLVLALGALGDPWLGDRMAEMIEGGDYRQESPLFRVLRSY